MNGGNEDAIIILLFYNSLDRRVKLQCIKMHDNNNNKLLYVYYTVLHDVFIHISIESLF